MQHSIVEKKLIVTLPKTNINHEVTVIDRVRGAILKRSKFGIAILIKDGNSKFEITYNGIPSILYKKK